MRFLLFFTLAFLHYCWLPYADAQVTVSSTVASSWNGGQQLNLNFKNGGSSAICGVKFSITFPSGTTITSSWNMDSAGGSTYNLPSWTNIAPGATQSAGLVTSGTGSPTVKVLSSTPCGGGGGGSGTTTTTTTKAGSKTTTTTTTQKPGGGGGGSSGGCCPYGQLSVKGTNLVGSDGQPVQLRGMSLFWSQWDVGSKFYNAQTVKCLKCSWNANIVRGAMGVDQGGYLSNPNTEFDKEYAVIKAAMDNCMYVLIDWHYTDSTLYTDKAVAFFSNVSKLCAGKCNCLYEDYNEPTSNDWSSNLKPYHEKVISAIRQNDKNNVVIVGTPTWDQDVDKAAADPIKDQTNVMYTLHFYAATHKQDLRDKAQAAIDKGLPLFVTEYGTTPASGDGSPDFTETQKWYDFLDKNKISYINWAVDDKAESSAALQPGSTPADVCGDSKLTSSGQFVKKMLTSKNAKPSGC